MAFDPETNAQIGWTLMCSPAAITSNVIGFLSLMPSKENTGLVAAVGVDESARGKGVGLALVVKALENMRERGVEGVYVDIPRLCCRAFSSRIMVGSSTCRRFQAVSGEPKRVNRQSAQSKQSPPPKLALQQSETSMPLNRQNTC